EPVSIRLTAHADDVGRADVGRDERHSDRPPGHAPPGEKEIAAGLQSAPDEEAERYRPRDVEDDDDVVVDVEHDGIQRRLAAFDRSGRTAAQTKLSNSRAVGYGGGLVDARSPLDSRGGSPGKRISIRAAIGRHF